MKRAIFFASLFAVAAPSAAQELAAVTTPAVNAPSAADDIPMASVMPIAPGPVIVKAAHNLRSGTVLHSSDLLLESGGDTALDLFVGMELKRSVYAGVSIKPSDVGAPTAIERNAIVSLEFVRGPLMITTEGRALDSGSVGEAVRIMNLNSKTILTATVSGPNKARAQ